MENLVLKQSNIRSLATQTQHLGIVAATPEQEKAFTDKYKAALEGKDTATLEASFTHKAPTPGPSSFTK